ncbi:hypothetical protein [Micromonospora psammae]|uniref:hypothetical protein n=1 Tax=Micromonospora sp. CPCC 205556 TaxID=3122398 RepID=UPI002FF185D6
MVTATPWQHEPPLSGSDYGPVIGLALQWGGQEHSILRMTGGAVLPAGLLEVPAGCTSTVLCVPRRGPIPDHQ